jgi:hypothetical protein
MRGTRKGMPSKVTISMLAGALALATAAPLLAQSKPADTSAAMPKVGDMAPDFKLHYFDGNDLKEVSLADYRGKKNVVLAFYVFAFTGG